MSTKRKPRGYVPRANQDLTRQVHLVSKDPEWNDQLDFICAALRCKPQEFFKDIVPIHYRHLIAGIRRNLDEQGIKHDGLGLEEVSHEQPRTDRDVGTERVGDMGAEEAAPEEGSAPASEGQEEVAVERDS